MTISMMNKNRDRKNLLFFDINPNKNFTTFGTGSFWIGFGSDFGQKWIFCQKKWIFYQKNWIFYRKVDISPKIGYFTEKVDMFGEIHFCSLRQISNNGPVFWH